MNIGILGAGSIAQKMAVTVAGMNDVNNYAVAAREKERAEAFAEKFGFAKSYGSYEAMLMDPSVDLVYVATPHSLHFEHVKLCLEHGKHVLCEKAFTQNAAQAREILAMAEEKKLLLTEAIWTRYMPMRETLDEIVASGIIGKVTSLTANLGYALGGVKRLLEPSLAGGALLDLGVYPINFALMVFGTEIEKITSSAVLTEKGVDARNSITIQYRDGKVANLYSDMMAVTDRRGVIFGDKGWIEVENINNCEKIQVYNQKYERIQTYERPVQITGYEYEVEACVQAIQKGELECPQMPHGETLRVMQMMDQLRSEWGVVYPGEKEGCA